MKRPSVWAIVFGAIPFVASCFTVPLWDRIHPTVFGIPFNFFWLILWMVLTPVCMFGAYKIEESRDSQTDEDVRE
jgi:Protein of unknown function (DUF3311)